MFTTTPENNTVLYSLFLEPVRVTSSKIGEGLLVTGKMQYLTLLYILVSLFFFGRLFAGILYTFQVRYSGQKSSKYGINMVITHRPVKPFTFMRTIVIGRDDSSRPELYQILLHEQVHAKKLHTIDLILIEIFKALCWFNPFAYLYQVSLREVHEYQADAAIIDKGHDSFSYQQLLLNQLFNTKNIQFSNFFNYSLTKKRIKMITNNKSSKYSIYKLLMILPLAFTIAVGFSCAKEEPGSKDNTDISNNEIIPITKNATTNSDSESENKNSADEEVFFIVEDMPTFQGKPVDNFRNYIADNIVYPEEAAKNGIEGKVFVQFKVNSSGKVADARIVRGVDPLLDAEALRVIKSSPDWEPGKQRGKKVCVMFTFPIKFELGK